MKVLQPGKDQPHLPMDAGSTPQLPPNRFRIASVLITDASWKQGDREGPRRKLFFPANKSGAGEGIRTLDPNLGKVVLYP